ncbi:MAG: glutamate synthase large subunit [Clostridia bacterium]|nr:glutamate synthase large subunit [Clostridia bacterium]
MAQSNQGLYRPEFEHDNCGIGAVANIKGISSHSIVDDALSIVENLEHRAGKDAEGETGDGVGILTQIPHKFMKKACESLGINIGDKRQYGVGMFFFPQDVILMNQAKKMFEVIVSKEGMEFLGWREVPTDPSVLGQKALNSMPSIQQGFVKRPEGCELDRDFDKKLYIVRRVFEQTTDNTYVPSLSCRTIVYKGMFLVNQLREFFLDLQDKDYESAIAMVHSRFSTNTNPSWERAHPNRILVHNGEINTIKGNADKMLAREETMHTEAFSSKDMTKILPVISSSGSDSAMLDNTLEFLVMSGMELPLAASILIPEPWTHNDTISQEIRDFYQYYATMMEPWDGPASILFSDGDVMGAILDRNGLRPSRYYVTDDDRLILSSEVGVLEVDEAHILKKERLHPGKILLIDTKEGKITSDEDLKQKFASKEPYGEWIDSNLINLHDLKVPNSKVHGYSEEELSKLLISFGYSYEEYKENIANMALNGSETIGAMGVDTPLAVLSDKYQPLFNYFKQMFAQVTNPPIDAVREKIVTSTTVYLGKNGNLLDEKSDNCQVLKIENPILSDLDLMKIEKMNRNGFKVTKVPITYYKSTPIDRVIDHLFVEVDKAYAEGTNILILSDRGVDEYHVALPSLLAVAAVHMHLVKTKKCTAMSIIIESGEPRDVHHFATLLGYGASAINPYLAHACIARLTKNDLIDKDYYAAVSDYDEAILHGIVKISSKMGISTIQSYQGSKIFEVIGIDSDVIDKYFTKTVSPIGGYTLKDIALATDKQHSKAFDPLGLKTDLSLPSVGAHKMRSEGEAHRYNPQTIHMLQKATRDGDYEEFKTYTSMVDKEETGYLRSYMDFKFADEAIPLDEVESEYEIVKRFKTGAMSYGSISQEAHETLAIAMNHLKGKSNSGEGGESEDRILSEGMEDNRNSAIKQVASGRFGVTSRYLCSAKEIQIKMAQGAKPGEGGHLPARKVYPWVAKTRHSTPGVSLISPPPHHDIYSIEDLAELIYDLKNANKYARISVKLVSEAGVGTVAAGVAKAGAQVILISGYDGGTGAAPLSSIHDAGLPWELGLAETHQTLISNGLREKVRIETDGKLMSGRDVAIAAILGAEEFGFATAPLITLGCVMMRVCNLDTCPLGIATQNPELRARFKGKPEYVENFMLFIARELREYMSKLGVRTVDELVGRTDLLMPKADRKGGAARINFNEILYSNENMGSRFCEDKVYDFKLEETVDEKVLLKNKDILNAISKGKAAKVDIKVKNTDRSFGTLLGAEVTRKHSEGLPDDTITINCTGAAGQSFGAFVPKGVTLNVTGDANDYLGKGLSGGRIIVKAPSNAGYDAENNIVVGNVALYGATSGDIYISGVAGERFCVRNSGANAVVEGVGEHGCEYMTGGKVVILGPTGKNFAAGMSGGVAYVYDEDNCLYRNLNKELVLMEKIENKFDKEELKNILEQHVKYTGSKKAQAILENFDSNIDKFKKIIPEDYKKLIMTTKMYEEQGMPSDEAQIEAFYECTREE